MAGEKGGSVVERRIITLLMEALMALTIGGALAALAAGEEPTKCNAGAGNGSEGVPDCDPGNSGGNNNAGD